MTTSISTQPNGPSKQLKRMVFITLALALFTLATAPNASADFSSDMAELQASLADTSAMNSDPELRKLSGAFLLIKTAEDQQAYKKMERDFYKKALSSTNIGLVVLGASNLASNRPEVFRDLYPLFNAKNAALRFAMATTLRDIAKKEGTDISTVKEIIKKIKAVAARETDPTASSMIATTAGDIEQHYGLDSSGNAAPDRIGIGKGYEIFITSAEWCGTCHLLHKNLEKEGKLKSISVTVDNQVIPLPILFVDVDKSDVALKAMDIPVPYLPQFHLIRDGKRVFTSKIGGNYDSEALESVAINALKNYNAKITAETVSPQELEDSLLSRPSPTARVTLIGTGAEPTENPLFVSFTLSNIKKALKEKYNYPEDQIVTLYGSGPKSTELDTRVDNKGKIEYKRVSDLKTDASFTSKTLEALYRTISKQGTKKSLWIYSGHGTRGGVGAWGEQKLIGPDSIQQFQNISQSQNIAISGNCYGGQFALSFDCGFFAARPDKLASGCWESRPEVIQDYASVFFKFTRPEARPITFEDSHWYAVARGDPGDSPYTSLDALADKYFLQNKAALPKVLSIQEIRDLAVTVGSAGERAALKALSQNSILNFDPSQKIAEKVLPPDTKVLLQQADVELKISTVPIRVNFDPMRAQKIYAATYSPADAAGLEATIRAFNQKGQKPIPSDAKLTSIWLQDSNDGTFWFAKFMGAKSAEQHLGLYPIDLDNPVTRFRSVLVQLARRLLFKRIVKTNPQVANQFGEKFEKIQRCEQQRIDEFLK